MDPVPQKAPVASPVAPGNAPATPNAVAPGNAAALAVKFGGNKGGRPRKDGLVPGSVEAIEADRQRDAERKRLSRAQASAVLAAAKTQGLASPDAPAVDPGAAPAPGVAPVPWDPGVLKPIFDQLVPALERWQVESIGAKAVKLGAPAELIGEIKKDAAWPIPSKAAIHATGPLCAAKWLNAAGIGAENAPEVILGTAIASIVASQLMLHSRLNQLAAAQRAEKPKPKSDAPAPKPA